jgi:hypothetical protein
MAYLTGAQIKPEGTLGGTCWHRGATPPCWRTRLRQPLPRPRSRHPLLRLLNGVLDVVDVGDGDDPGEHCGLRGLRGDPHFRGGLRYFRFQVHPRRGLAARGGWDGGCWGFSVCASFDQRLLQPGWQPQRLSWVEVPLMGSVRVELIELPAKMKKKY